MVEIGHMAHLSCLKVPTNHKVPPQLAANYICFNPLKKAI